MRNTVLIVFFVSSFFFLRLLQTSGGTNSVQESSRAALPLTQPTEDDPALRWFTMLTAVALVFSAGVSIRAFLVAQKNSLRPVLILESNGNTQQLRNVGLGPALNVKLLLTERRHTMQSENVSIWSPEQQRPCIEFAALAPDETAPLPVMNSDCQIVAAQYNSSFDKCLCSHFDDKNVRIEECWPFGDLPASTSTAPAPRKNAA